MMKKSEIPGFVGEMASTQTPEQDCIWLDGELICGIK